MQMNPRLQRSLSEALASHLQREIDHDCWSLDWGMVADEVMEFMYGEEDHPESVDRGTDHHDGLSVCRRDSGVGPSLLGVVPSPEPHRCGEFVYLGGPQSLTAEYVPAPRSCCAQTPPSPPGQAEAA